MHDDPMAIRTLTADKSRLEAIFGIKPTKVGVYPWLTRLAAAKTCCPRTMAMVLSAQSCASDGRETATRVKNTVKTAVTTNSFIILSPLAD